jgi:hypothetical protein
MVPKKAMPFKCEKKENLCQFYQKTMQGTFLNLFGKLDRFKVQ